jgi:hypothetical protein
MARELEPNINLFLNYLPSIPHRPLWVLWFSLAVHRSVTKHSGAHLGEHVWILNCEQTSYSWHLVGGRKNSISR